MEAAGIIDGGAAAGISSAELRLVAFHPGISLARTRDWHDLKLLLQGLARVALLSNRSIVWPDLPCHDTPWLHFNATEAPFKAPGCMLPHLRDGVDKQPQCLLLQTLHTGCLVGGLTLQGCRAVVPMPLVAVSC
jgi:hypothetical protein